MSVPARIVHHVSGRTRLKIPDRQGDVIYFDRVSDRLSDCSGVTAVESNFRTGGVLIRHAGPLASIAAFAAAQGLFVLAADPPAPLPLAQRLAAGLRRLEQDLVDLSGGGLNGRSLVIIALLSLSAVQIARGQILAPASSLLLHALALLDRVRSADNSPR